MADVTDLSVQILQDIRKELREFREEVREETQELREQAREFRQDTDARLALLSEGMIRGQSILTEVAEALHVAIRWIARHEDVPARLARCEAAIAELRAQR